MPRRLRICGYCGDPATTRDHIPPKGIFPSPRPDDLITVPSCAPCNQGASDTDERFRVYLSLHVGLETKPTEQLWHQALPGIRRNHPLHQHLLRLAEPTWLTTPSGVILGRGHRALWDSEAHDRTVERMVRGLYFHHYRDVLDDRAEVRVQWFRQLEPDIIEATKDFSQRSIGNDQFVYRFARVPDNPLYSTWLFEFHKRHWAGGYSVPLQGISDNAMHDMSGGMDETRKIPSN